MFKLDFVFFSFSAGGYCSQPGGNQRWRVQILLMPRQVPRAHCIAGHPPCRPTAMGCVLAARTAPRILGFALLSGQQCDLGAKEALGPSPAPLKGQPQHRELYLDLHLVVEHGGCSWESQHNSQKSESAPSPHSERIQSS